MIRNLYWMLGTSTNFLPTRKDATYSTWKARLIRRSDIQSTWGWLRVPSRNASRPTPSLVECWRNGGTPITVTCRCTLCARILRDRLALWWNGSSYDLWASLSGSMVGTSGPLISLNLSPWKQSVFPTSGFWSKWKVSRTYRPLVHRLQRSLRWASPPAHALKRINLKYWKCNFLVLTTYSFWMDWLCNLCAAFDASVPF